MQLDLRLLPMLWTRFRISKSEPCSATGSLSPNHRSSFVRSPLTSRSTRPSARTRLEPLGLATYKVGRKRLLLHILRHGGFPSRSSLAGSSQHLGCIGRDTGSMLGAAVRCRRQTSRDSVRGLRLLRQGPASAAEQDFVFVGSRLSFLYEIFEILEVIIPALGSIKLSVPL